MTDDILAAVADGVGHATLNRPKALNALSFAMLRELAGVMKAWVDDPEVGLVVLDGAGERGFSAGGDIRELRDFALEGRQEEAQAFFRAEYRLDDLIAEFPKPVVALMDGITMGGGIGLTGHATVRVVTERSRLAMPETRIGFTPDVGGSYLLSRAPGELGTYLGLNAATMDAADAIHAGFADVLVPSEHLGHLVQALAERADPGTPAEIVRLFDETPGQSRLALKRDWIDACYSASTVAGIIERLRALAAGERVGGVAAAESADPDAAANAASAADELEALSPTGLTFTLAAIRRARTLPELRDVFEQEFRLVTWFMRQHDLLEGIRAQVVDKDRNPKWSPASLAEVDAGLVQRVLTEAVAEPVWADRPAA
ncbi:enoyl-CoA hydratase/isomerase family protein [Agromyces archimandritae]|uniref:enoyl-CoA hydratase/isomerase family protein n=1 Tax=Agromyces archimandritae TaxID=2781962 RepID=UPI001FD3E877|nr:enoyl-CoA hydratase/isomerase family protein [Agromyces archimandritae]